MIVIAAPAWNSAMSLRSFGLAARLRAFGSALDGAATAAAAVRDGRRPPRAALAKLGIDPHAFDDVTPR